MEEKEDAEEKTEDGKGEKRKNNRWKENITERWTRNGRRGRRKKGR